MRPAALADDFTGTAAVIAHAVDALAQQGQVFDYACCIYATAPLLQASFLREGFELLERHPERSFAFSVCEFGFPIQRALTPPRSTLLSLHDALPIQRALTLTGDGALTALYPEHRQTRSQDLPPAFQDAGQFYWGRSAAWLRGDVLFSDKSLPVLLPRHLVQDIDTPEDWRRAEYLYSALQAAGELQS